MGRRVSGSPHTFRGWKVECGVRQGAGGLEREVKLGESGCLPPADVTPECLAGEGYALRRFAALSLGLGECGCYGRDVENPAAGHAQHAGVVEGGLPA